jgi:hypothetical protein
VLLTTPLQPEEIIQAKWLGSLLSIRWGWVWLGSIAGLGVISMGLHVLALPLLCLCWASYGCFLAALGLRFSLNAPTTLRAMVLTVLTAGGLWLGPWLVVSCCGMSGAFLGRGAEHFLFLLAGLTPPVALGFLAFGYQDDLWRSAYQGEIVIFALIGAIVWASVGFGLLGLTREQFRQSIGRRDQAERTT